jgi:hypothetical protein
MEEIYYYNKSQHFKIKGVNRICLVITAGVKSNVVRKFFFEHWSLAKGFKKHLS